MPTNRLPQKRPAMFHCVVPMCPLNLLLVCCWRFPHKARCPVPKNIDFTHFSGVLRSIFFLLYTIVTQVELIDGERVFGDYDEGVLEKYKLTDEDIDYIKNFDVVICDVWGKVEGQFKELKEKGIVTAFDCATSPDSEESVKAIPYTDYLFYSVDTGDTKEEENKWKEFKNRDLSLSFV